MDLKAKSDTVCSFACCYQQGIHSPCEEPTFPLPPCAFLLWQVAGVTMTILHVKLSIWAVSKNPLIVVDEQFRGYTTLYIIRILITIIIHWESQLNQRLWSSQVSCLISDCHSALSTKALEGLLSRHSCSPPGCQDNWLVVWNTILKMPRYKFTWIHTIFDYIKMKYLPKDDKMIITWAPILQSSSVWWITNQMSSWHSSTAGLRYCVAGVVSLGLLCPGSPRGLA